jgi:HlyD family secretion protein
VAVRFLADFQGLSALYRERFLEDSRGAWTPDWWEAVASGSIGRLVNSFTPSATDFKRSAGKFSPVRRGRIASWGGVVVLLILLIVGFLPKPVSVEMDRVRRGAMRVWVREEGKTRVRNRYQISAPVAGWLRRIPFRAGDRVIAGETKVAEMEPESSSLLNPRAAAEAEARLKAAQSGVERAGADVDRVRTGLEFAEREKRRIRELRDTGAVSERDWDAAENRVAVGTRELKVAEFGYRVAEAERAQAEAVLERVRVPNGEVREALAVVAPVTGSVLEVKEESARAVLPGAVLMEVGDLEDLEVEIELLSNDAVGVQRGAEVLLEGWGGAVPLRGTVATIEPGGFTKVSALGVEEQRVRVRVDLERPLPDAQRLGDRFRVDARVEIWRGDDVLQVPVGAVFRVGKEWRVYVVENGRARSVPVELGHSNGEFAEVKAGLLEGAAVVVHPPDALKSGIRVEAQSAPAEASR